MSSTLVAKRYADALLEVASERNEVDVIELELQYIKQAIEENPVFLQLLKHPQITKDTKKQKITSVFKGRVSETTMDFLNLLIDKNRESIITYVPVFFTEQANELRGFVDAVVTSVKPLSEEQKTEIAQSFNRLLNKKIRVQNQLDPSILGGVIVQIGGRLYDGSVTGRLNRFQQSLKHAQ